MIYLDANFFIFLNFDQTERGNRAGKLLQKIVDGRQAIISTLAIDEVTWVVTRKEKKRDAFHAAIMKQHSTEEIISDDKDFDRAKWIKRTAI